MSAIKTRYSKVVDFNKDVLGIEERAIGLQGVDEVSLSVIQLIEEAKELRTANIRGKLVDAVDAVIDSIYFAYGILYKMGVDEDKFDDIFDVVHEANMRKVKGKKENRPSFEGTADAAKPEDWEGPEALIKEILDRP